MDEGVASSGTPSNKLIEILRAVQGDRHSSPPAAAPLHTAARSQPPQHSGSPPARGRESSPHRPPSPPNPPALHSPRSRSPAPPAPPRSTSSAGCAPCTVVARILTPASRSQSRASFSFAQTSGIRNTLPADARTALGFQALTVPGRHTTPSAPKASADRTIVPRFPGSCSPAKTTISAADSFRSPTTCAQVQSGGSTSAASGCGASVVNAASSSSRGIASTSIRSGSLSASTRRSDPCATKTHAMCRPARTASARRFGPSMPASPFSFRPGLASARLQFLQPRVLLTLYNAYRHSCEPSSA